MTRSRTRERELVEDDSDGEPEQGDVNDIGQAPANKRQRTGASAYPRGTVKQVKVSNFMTYGDPPVTITPGPRLNLVLGPNGTGKSSLVCALCVGLGGSTKLLGRADNVKDYIRRGTDRGWVETTLSGGEGNPDIVIRCEMAKSTDGYSTTWKINRVSKPKKDVVELVKSLNIQFDNLCQFLPQDKVVEFARMDQYELLVATEKAIGDASLFETHNQLIAKRDEVKELQVAANASQQRHEQLIGENQKLERDYERFKRRKTLQDRIGVMKKKYAWMGVKEHQDKAKAAEDDAKAAQQAFNQAKEEANHDVRPLKQKQQRADAAKTKTADLKQAVMAKERQMKAVEDKLTKEDDAVRDVRSKINGLQDASNKLAAEKEKTRIKLKQVEDKLASLPPIPDYSGQQQQLQQQIQDLNDQITNLEGEKMQLLQERGHVMHQQGQMAAELRHLDSAKHQRLRALAASRPGHNGLESAYKWIEQQKANGAFKGEVLGPLGLEIKIKNDRFAANLEQGTFAQLCDFVTTDKDDNDYIRREFEQQKIRSAVINIDADAEMPRSEADQCRQYGVACSLDDVYDAHPLVKKALADLCNLPRVYVVTHNDKELVQRLMEDKKINKVFTTEVVMTYIASSLGTNADAATQNAPLYQSKVFRVAASASDERKEQLLQQLGDMQARLQHIDQQIAAKTEEQGPLNLQIEALQKQKQALTNEVMTLNRKRATLVRGQQVCLTNLAKLEKTPDPLKEQPKLEKQLQKALAGHHAALTAQLDASLAMWQLLQQCTVAEMTWRELDMQARALQNALDARRAALRQLEQAAQAAATRAQAAKRAYAAAKREAEDEYPLDDELRRRFQQMPDDRDELQALINELEVEVAGIAVNNPRVVEEYRKRQAEIERLSHEITSQKQQLDTLHAEIDGLKERWLPELKRVVGLINESFSTNMRDISCAGEVLLGQHEDYDKFSIQIKVKFRHNEELELLTAHRQSGGERSVSTILYLIALQGVTVTPFRVIDEINQGMDAVNERKVFKLLVDASCQEGTPQCFLLTPKLLPDLPFTENITILNIFNGGLIDQQISGQYSRKMLFGAALDQLQPQVPVVG